MADISSMTRRGFLGATGAASLLVAGVLAGCSSSSASGSASASGAAKTVDANLAEMTWDEVLTEAKGQSVVFCAWDTDIKVKAWWDYLADYVSKEYGITLNYVPDDAANEEKILTDIKNGGEASIDMFWGMGASMSKYHAENGLFGNAWLSKCPSAKYLDGKDARVVFDGAQAVNDAELPFQTLNPSLVYSKDEWNKDLAWDEEKDGLKGLFHNFSELYQWVQKYPGKFTYMDLTAAGAFHGRCFLRAILAELTDDGNGGWKPVYEESDNAQARHDKIAANNQAWYEWLQTSEATEEAFYTKAAYLWAYLNDLKPYLLQGEGAPLYAADAGTMMNYVLSGDLACTFTTCTSISSRVESNPENYMPNPQIYMMQTSIGMWDYVVITGNSTKKAAAIVIANAMLDPALQAEAFNVTGNGYNVSYDLLDKDQKEAFDKVFSGFLPGTSPSAEEIASNSYSDVTGKVNAWCSTGWNQFVNKA